MTIQEAGTSVRPSYRDLPSGNAAGVFGKDDRFGCLTLLTPARVLRAIAEVHDGATFGLSAPMDWPNPPLYGRGPLEHHVFKSAKGNLDEYYDKFYPQASSQWDGFLHIRDAVSGFYNGGDESNLGIETWGRRGIVGRGLLLDVARWRLHDGRPIDWRRRDAITVADLERCAAWQDSPVEEGDILLVRTGWADGYSSSSPDERIAHGSSPPSPGLATDPAIAERLWDWGVAAVAGDNPALEAAPAEDGFLHPFLLARLGLPIGELFQLGELAAACADDRRYSMLFVAVPWSASGGIGSPANALAIR